MNKLLNTFITLAIALGISVGASGQGRGNAFSTKAVEALEECFNSSSEWICGGGELLTSDGTDITLASGQLLLPDGAVGTPSLSFASSPTTGIYLDATVVNVVSGGVFQGAFVSESIRMSTLGDVTNPEFTWFGDVNTGFYWIGADNFGAALGGALVMDWEDTNAAGEGADLVTISSQLGIMGGGDTFRALFIDPTSADHTGGANSNTFIGLDIDGIVGDADALEYAQKVGTGWDAAFFHVGIAHASLQTTDNGSFVFCTDCDPTSTPCTTGGASTGAFAFRVAGAWDCPM